MTCGTPTSMKIIVYFHTKERIVVPLHKRDLPKGTLLEILKQAGISKEELKDLL
jgi:predicted RNA binding protein YcfA (HicA-like mRNA interferase family)